MNNTLISKMIWVETVRSAYSVGVDITIEGKKGTIVVTARRSRAHYNGKVEGNTWYCVAAEPLTDVEALISEQSYRDYLELARKEDLITKIEVIKK